MRDTADIQFAPVKPVEPPKPPEWLEAISRFMRDLLEPVGNAIGVSWPVVEKILIGLAALLALYIVWRILAPLIDQWRSRQPAPEPEWVPDRAAAIALLEDADRLAAAGQFGEAVHLLLQRSVSHIADARPEWLNPATTAREISAIPSLPDRARRAFGEIAVRVERSLFALRRLDSSDWQAARTAYADFALADLSA